MLLRTLESRRLTLVAATTELVITDLEGSKALSEALGAQVPDNWPPELYDRSPMEQAMHRLNEPAEQGWSFWYLLSGQDGTQQAIGICGFKGRPDEAGSVEIGYSVLSQFRNQGYASESVARLLAWAFSHLQVKEVCAETLPHLKQSIRVMEKNGFVFTGSGSEQGVVRYAVKRPD
jgi:RimJ/RimL family protein N-acetyltransferase